MEELPKPISKQDKFLHNIADGTPAIDDIEAISRQDKYLKYIALNGNTSEGNINQKLGTWSPTLVNYTDSAHPNVVVDPTYSVVYSNAYYLKTGKLVYISFRIKVEITDIGTGYACVAGLPFNPDQNMIGQSFCISENSAVTESDGVVYDGVVGQLYPDIYIETYNERHIPAISLRTDNGIQAKKFKVGTNWISYSGCYVCDDDYVPPEEPLVTVEHGGTGATTVSEARTNLEVYSKTETDNLLDSKANTADLSVVATSGSYTDLSDKPTIPTKTSDLTNDSEFITNSVNNLVNYYTKSDTYTQTEIDNLVSAIPKFTIAVVAELPEQDISTTTIYLVPSDSEPENLYKEYIYINDQWELIGIQKADLTNYYNKSQVDDLLSNKADNNAVTALSGDVETNTNNISALTSQVETNTSDISALTSQVGTNTSDIAKLNTDLSNKADTDEITTDYNDLENKPTKLTDFSGVLPINQGGTGASTSENARTNLDVYSKSEVDNLIPPELEIVQETGQSETDVMSQKASTQLFAPKEHLHYSYDINTNYFIKNQLVGISNLSKIIRINYNSSSPIYYGMFNSHGEKTDGVYKYTYYQTTNNSQYTTVTITDDNTSFNYSNIAITIDEANKYVYATNGRSLFRGKYTQYGNGITSFEKVGTLTGLGTFNSVDSLDYYAGRFFLSLSAMQQYDKFYTSTDGLNWAVVESMNNTVSGSDSVSLYYLNNKYFIILYNKGIYSSDDGVNNWTKVLDKNDSGTISSLIYGNGMYVAKDSGGRKFYTSTDGTSWETITNTSTYCDILWYNAKDKNFYTLRLDGYEKKTTMYKTSDLTKYTEVRDVFIPTGTTTTLSLYVSTNNEIWIKQYSSDGYYMYYHTDKELPQIVNIPCGGTGATTAEEARNNLDVYSKSEVDDLIPSEFEIVQETGTSEIAVMSQKAVTDAIPTSLTDFGGVLTIEQGGTGATTTEDALTNLGTVPVYTVVTDFISLPATTSEIVQAMPSPAILMTWVDTTSNSITDLPCNYGTLTICKRSASRVQILYNRSYEGAVNGNHFYFGNYNTSSKTVTWNKIFTDYSGCQIPIANGGTGASTAENARANLDVYSKLEIDTLLKPTVLYSNDEGTQSSITLSDSAENYSYFEIYFRGNDGERNMCKVFQPNGAIAMLSTSLINNVTLYQKTSCVQISGTSISWIDVSHGWAIIANGQTANVNSSVNKIYIMYVIGYK